MNHHAHSTPPVRTWRDIEQSIAPRAMSSEGRRRLMTGTLRSVLALFALCLAAWAVFELWSAWETNPAKLVSSADSVPVKTIALRTDGVLDQAWVSRTLALPKKAGLMELDLYALQARLLAHGQVRTAVVSRKFPDTLSVVLEERSPVARVMAQAPGEEPKAYLVARDGVIYAGINHAAPLLASLPFLDGVALRRAQGRFQPLAGMELVADLLGTAHANVPALYRDWHSVSLARLATDGEIVVRSKHVKEITFGIRDDFFRQIAQLDLIVEQARLQPGGPALRAVNLAVGGIQVPVSFEPPAAPDPGSASPVRVPAPAAPRAEPRRPNQFTLFHPATREL